MNNETNKQVEAFEDSFFDWLLGPSSEELSNVGKSQISTEYEKKESPFKNYNRSEYLSRKTDNSRNEVSCDEYAGAIGSRNDN